MALAGMGGNGATPAAVPPPQVTDPNEGALKWAAVILPTATAITAGYFGYKLGSTQSDNAAATSIAGYGTMATLGTSGTTAATNIATAGFGAFAALPPSSQTTTTNTMTVGAGSAGAIGGAATLDQSRRCATTYSQPITVAVPGSTTPPTAVAVNNPFAC
jgi:hypothetical protein